MLLGRLLCPGAMRDAAARRPLREAGCVLLLSDHVLLPLAPHRVVLAVSPHFLSLTCMSILMCQLSPSLIHLCCSVAPLPASRHYRPCPPLLCSDPVLYLGPAASCSMSSAGPPVSYAHVPGAAGISHCGQHCGAQYLSRCCAMLCLNPKT